MILAISAKPPRILNSWIGSHQHLSKATGALRSSTSSSSCRPRGNNRLTMLGRPNSNSRIPKNAFIWRTHVRRLTAEQMRDAALMVSGELDQTVGGPSVDGSELRRSIYIKSFRNTPHSFLHAFDTANGLKSVAQRDTTTTPTTVSNDG